MSVLPILLWPDRRLSEVCAPVGIIDDEVTKLADDMLQTMYAAPGRGLAAPQVGALKRLFVMDATWKDAEPTPMVFVDPVLTWASEARGVVSEGCLSIPGVALDVERPSQVGVRWTDLEGHQQKAVFCGFEAVCIQHEMDHLDGKVTFDRVDDETRARVLKDYNEGVA